MNSLKNKYRIPTFQTKDFNFIIPDSININYQARVEYQKIMTEIKEAIEKMRSLGVKEEELNYLLPLGACFSSCFCSPWEDDLK